MRKENQKKRSQEINSKKSFARFFLIMAVGAILGFTMASLTRFLGGDRGERLTLAAENFQLYLVRNSLWYGIGMIVIFIVLFAVGYVRTKRAAKEETEEAAGRVESGTNMQTLAAEMNLILQFILFGISADSANPYFAGTLVLFLLACLTTMAEEVVAINNYRRYDPMKKGDPSHFRFEQEWEQSLDEAEKLMSYKTGYRAFTLQKKLMPILLCVTVLGRLMLGWGLVPIVLVGADWIFLVLSVFYYDRKLSREKLG